MPACLPQLLACSWAIWKSNHPSGVRDGGGVEQAKRQAMVGKRPEIKMASRDQLDKLVGRVQWSCDPPLTADRRAVEGGAEKDACTPTTLD